MARPDTQNDEEQNQIKELEKEDKVEVLKRSIDKPTINSILYNEPSSIEPDIIRTPMSIKDEPTKDSKVQKTLTSPNTTAGADAGAGTPSTPLIPSKRKDSNEDDTSTSVKPVKKSRKLQGAGVKKPLYTRYESIFIIKSFKAITDKIPNLVLVDLFKIISLLFNEEAKRQGFKERTSDQLYQKYKRIQHGLNHGEVEFTDFFERNRYNPKEWMPNFAKVEKTDEILKYIKFNKLDESIKSVLGSSVANLKPPLPDPNDMEDSLVQEEAEDNVKVTESERKEKPDIQWPSKEKETQVKYERESPVSPPDDELLKLAGFDIESEPKVSAAAAALTSLDPSNYMKRSTSIGPHQSEMSIQELKAKLHNAHQEIHRQKDMIRILEHNMILKNQECQFLKGMIKEDLSYIRLKLNENNGSNSTDHNSILNHHHHHERSQHQDQSTRLPALLHTTSSSSNKGTPSTASFPLHLSAIKHSRYSDINSTSHTALSTARPMALCSSTSSVNVLNNDMDNISANSHNSNQHQHRHSMDYTGLQSPFIIGDTINAAATGSDCFSKKGKDNNGVGSSTKASDQL